MTRIERSFSTSFSAGVSPVVKVDYPGSRGVM